MTKSKVFSILLLIPLLAFSAHKFYLSLINVEYKAEQETIQITMRVFIDDLQKVINETNDTFIELGVKDEVKDSNNLINNYIGNNFKVIIDSKETAFKYLGKEYDNDIVFLYLEVTDVKKINTIEIQNTMLMDYFSTQKNIIKLNINDKKKTFLLTKEHNKDSYTF